MKKIFMLFVIIFTAINFTACGNDKPAHPKKIKIVGSGFAECDWAYTIVGKNEKFSEILILMDNGVNLHNFKPTAQDIENISTCDVLIYVGGEESKVWAEDALKHAKNKNMIVVNLSEVLGDKVLHEEINGVKQIDEHSPISLRNAQIFCDAITDALVKAAPEHETVLRQNNAAYKSQLAALDKKYIDTFAAAQDKTICIADQFPCRYLFNDYDLKYISAFENCSADDKISPEKTSSLAKKSTNSTCITF